MNSFQTSYKDNKKRTILIVDDEVINQKILENILKDEYQILFASDGIEALDVIRENSNIVSLVLLDLHIPNLSGLEVLKAVRADHLTRDIPVIVMTAEAEVEEECLSHGVSDFITKPFGAPGVIRARISNIIRMNESTKQINTDIYDDVTGLYNMRAFLKGAESIRESVMQGAEKEKHAVLYFNLTNFKLFNTIYGTESGDQLLHLVGDILRHVFPDRPLARFADDHFVALAESDNLIDKLTAVCHEIDDLGKNSHLRTKIGIKYLSEEDLDTPIATVCDQAKIACDSIKNNVEEYFSIYSRELTQELGRKTYIIEHLDEAIENEYLQIYLQPVIRSISRTLCSAEALIRWVDPELGFLSPGEFIPVLEEAHLIHKVDMFVIRKICQEYRKAIDTNQPVIPISFNLSRLDFVLCDISDYIFEMVEKYQVPRSMLNIEITESMFVQDPERIGRELERFHEHGFKVWMDDFGSGYSSLNILKDYHFDELKIDMVFLSSFNETSKSILRSIIRMAKEIGIQTLAEDVETEEQFEFLKQIGCEKIQGYYFGKPQPAVETIRESIRKEIRIETKAWNDYYDAVGKLDFLTDAPLAIFEDNGSDLHFLFANEAYRDSLYSNGTKSLEEAEKNINAPGTPMQATFRQFVDSMIRSGDKASMTYPSGDQYMSLKARTIAHCNGNYMHAASLINITRNSDQESQNVHDGMMRNILYLYRVIALVDYKADTIEYFDAIQGDATITQNRKVSNVLESTREYCNELVFPDDRQEFMKFTDRSTLKQKLENSSSGFISNYFRTKDADGSYRWKVSTILVLPKTEFTKYLVVTRDCAFDDEEIRTRLIRQYNSDFVAEREENLNEDIFSDHLMWSNLKKYSNVKYFWKDADRRFIGVSQSFLDYYGLESEDQLIGKTDEDMQWHVSDGPYRNDEEEILTQGKRTRSVPGKCIIRGVLHNILASKMPIYRDGKIVGLFGYFADADAMTEDEKELRATVDLVTGLANTRGLMENLISYYDEYRKSGTDFVAMNIDLDGYDEFEKEFGREEAHALAKKCSEFLIRELGTGACTGRMMGGRFISLLKNPDQRELLAISGRIKEDIRNVTEINGHSCTLFVRLSYVYAGSSSDMEDMVIHMLKQNKN